MSVKVSDIVATVSVRVCGDGGNNSKLKKNQPAHAVLVLIASMHNMLAYPAKPEVYILV